MSAGTDRRTLWLHLALVLALSAAWEALFLFHGISLIDEGWRLYAASRLHQGGTLYHDVMWVYPPGHVLPAWLGIALDPPGLVVTRSIDSILTSAACVALYLLARKLLSPRFALAAALVVAVAAPYTHRAHVLFGFLYLVFPILGLLAFQRRLCDDDRRWLVLAGCLVGISGSFRLFPGFATGLAIGVATMAAHASVRRVLRDWGAFALGIALTMGSTVLWFGTRVGFATLWREIVTRPAQTSGSEAYGGTPAPALFLLSSWDRMQLRDLFVALEFRMAWVLYAAYLLVLGAGWLLAWRRRESYAQPLLLAVAVWGALLLTRCIVRSDEAHLDGSLPPLCLLFVHGVERLWQRVSLGPPKRAWAERGLVAVLLGSWIFLTGADLFLDEELRGAHPLASTDGRIRVPDREWARALDATVNHIRGLPPDVVLLDITGSPLLYVLGNHPGPGGLDVLVPGSFLNRAEQEEFIARLERAGKVVTLLPPAWTWSLSRSVPRTAPHLWKWIMAHQVPREAPGELPERED